MRNFDFAVANFRFRAYRSQYPTIFLQCEWRKSRHLSERKTRCEKRVAQYSWAARGEISRIRQWFSCMEFSYDNTNSSHLHSDISKATKPNRRTNEALQFSGRWWRIYMQMCERHLVRIIRLWSDDIERQHTWKAVNWTVLCTISLWRSSDIHATTNRRWVNQNATCLSNQHECWILYWYFSHKNYVNGYIFVVHTGNDIFKLTRLHAPEIRWSNYRSCAVSV